VAALRPPPSVPRQSPLMGGRPCRMLQCSARRTGIQGVPSSAQSPGRRSPVTRRDARACAGGIGGDARAGRKKGDAHLRGGAGGMGRALVREEKLWRTTRVTARARRLFERMPEPRCASETAKSLTAARRQGPPPPVLNIYVIIIRSARQRSHRFRWVRQRYE